MDLMGKVIGILYQALGIDPESQAISADSRLMGEMPEFDSVSVVNLLTAFEDQFGVTIEDDELDVEVFESVKSLTDYLYKKGNYSV